MRGVCNMDENEVKTQIDHLLREVTALLTDQTHRFNDGTRDSWIKQLRESAAVCREKGWSVAERTLEHNAELVLTRGSDQDAQKVREAP
jgi:hypothetical protein